MKTRVDEIEAAIKQFEAVVWSNSGYPMPCKSGEPIHAGWVKFGFRQSPLGWRTLEFLAWIFTDMECAGERLQFFPTAPPPYLNTPGDCLSFVVECYPLDDDQDERFRCVANFIDSCRQEYWLDCCRDLQGLSGKRPSRYIACAGIDLRLTSWHLVSTTRTSFAGSTFMQRLPLETL